jgi:hypothetical protein
MTTGHELQKMKERATVICPALVPDRVAPKTTMWGKKRRAAYALISGLSHGGKELRGSEKGAMLHVNKNNMTRGDVGKPHLAESLSGDILGPQKK